ncbi:MAG: hypothetical protein DRG24_01965 [Epsilonproteobacteria bacterium]|nr:MAG: hypothetical protein DRG24_01965 [Campylobacterota bacterium]
MYKSLLFLFVLSVSVWAERSGPYIGFGVGLADYNDDGRLAEISDNSNEALRLYAGAYINEYLSVEFDYSGMMEFQGQSITGGDVTNEFSVFSVAALAHYPISDNSVDLYAKFGAGQLFWEESGSEEHSDDSATILLGLGLGYRLMETLTLNLGYDLYSFSMDVANEEHYNMSLGLVYMKVEVQF